MIIDNCPVSIFCEECIRCISHDWWKESDECFALNRWLRKHPEARRVEQKKLDLE